MLANRLFSSLVSCIISRFRLLSSSFNVVSSSLVDCNSSFAVSSSSLVDCSSSLLDSISSLADFSSSLVASCSSMMVCNDSLEVANSPRNFSQRPRKFSRLVSFGGLVKNNQQPRSDVPGDFEWHNLNIYFVASASQLHFRALCPGRFVRFDGATNRGAQVRHQSGPRKLEK